MAWTSENTLDAVKTGVIVYLGWQLIQAIEGTKEMFEDNPGDSGTAHLDCDLSELQDLNYTAFEYDGFADQINGAIWNTGLFALWERDEAIAATLMQMLSLDDFIALSCAYGERGAPGAWSEKYSLIMAVEKFLDAKYKAEVNEYYSSIGINFQFA